MPKYKIAIPSYKRAETLKEKTLSLLERLKIPKKIITIFVANEEEEKRYKKINPGYKIVKGVQGMKNIRNFIRNYYKEGERIVNIDDDISDLMIKQTDKKVAPLKDLNSMVIRGFEVCEKQGATLFGIYPLVNPLFMKFTITIDLKYIVGAFWGCINSHAPGLYVTIDDKEDFERTLQYYEQDGVIVRLNYIGIKSNYYGEEGGMQSGGELTEARTETRVHESCLYLLKKYPLLCSWNKARKNHSEIKLKDKTKGLLK